MRKKGLLARLLLWFTDRRPTTIDLEQFGLDQAEAEPIASRSYVGFGVHTEKVARDREREEHCTLQS
jgi:hypothetical protein